MRHGSSALPPVLLLDSHTNQALACARSLGRAGRRLLTASRRRGAMAGWSRWSVARMRLRADSAEAYGDLRVWARRLGAALVLPMTERSCLLCNEDRRAWEAAGITVGCPPNDLLLRAFDKAQTLEAAERAGVQTPATVIPASYDESERAVEAVGYPCVVKSRFSDAWLEKAFVRGGGVTYVQDPARLVPAVEAHRQGPYWPIVQRFVGGRGVGVSGLCDRGRPLVLFAHERLRDVRPSGSGSSLRRSIVLEPRLREPVERLLGELGWHGPVMVEFRDDGGIPCLMEVNGRFWGSLQLAISCGIDLPGLWVAMLEGCKPQPGSTYRGGVSLRWLWGDVKRLLKICQGAPADYPGRYPSLLEGLREVLGPQPPGTTIETWDAQDPLPGVAEWVQGSAELLEYLAGQLHLGALLDTNVPAGSRKLAGRW